MTGRYAAGTDVPAAALRLGEGLVLPAKFATEGVVAVGMRGSGKSNTLVRWAEVLYEAGISFVAIDPKGDWGGIRSSADGTKPGLSVAVFGGIEESFPLTEGQGATIADLLVDHNLSAVLDVSRLSIAARARFLTDFCHRLMDRHQVEPHVRCVILEEAHRYIPQQVTRETAKVKEAAAAILLEGRAFGLGCWAATQRPARLHKDVLEEVGTAVLHRIGAAATNDLRTISGWVRHEELGEEIVPSLTKLASGEAWVLAPSTLGIAQRVQIDRRTTWDSGATPLVGAGSRPTLTLADVDTAAIKEALAETIERAKADDPKLLRRRITELERQLAVAEAHVCEAPAPVEVEVPVLPDELIVALAKTLGPAVELLAAIHDKLETHVATPPDPPARPVHGLDQVGRPDRPIPIPISEAKPLAEGPHPADTPKLGKAERAMLTVLAQHPAGRTKTQLALLSGYSIKSSAIGNALGALRSAGYVNRGDPIQATPEGIAALGDHESLPAGRALYDWWASRLGKAERAILGVLADAWPDELDKTTVADRSGYSATSSALGNALGKLRSLELVDGWQAHDDFMAAIRG